MKLATFTLAGSQEPLAGEVVGDEVVVFGDGSTVLDRLASGDRSPATGERHRLSAVELLAPHAPRTILAVGLNYRSHVEETGHALPAEPLIFVKGPNTAAAPNADVARGATTMLDYEAELAVVMGAGGEVAGFAVADDVSARDWQQGDDQWWRGKGADGFCPFGPWITTADELPDAEDLGLRCWVNGELRQEAHTSDLIFGVERLLAFIGGPIRLQPGDMVLTGTPSGVGVAMDPPVALEPGDVVRIEIEALGTIEHRIAA